MAEGGTSCSAAACSAAAPLVVVRVAIFGAGGHARRAHAPNLRALPGVEIVAIADASLCLAGELAADFAPGARLYADGHAMLAAEDGEIDALFSGAVTVQPARVHTYFSIRPYPGVA